MNSLKTHLCQIKISEIMNDVLTLDDFINKKDKNEKQKEYNLLRDRHLALLDILKDLEQHYWKTKSIKDKLNIAREIRFINDSLEKYKITSQALDIEVLKAIEIDKQLVMDLK